MLALARLDSIAGSANPIDEALEPAFGKSGTARLRVIDKNRWMPGIHMQGRGHPSDIPTVAGGNQGKQPDHGVLGRMQRSGELVDLQTSTQQAVFGHREPD